MAAFIKERWIMLVLLAIFISFKVPHLNYPYYWDESWPYAAAIQNMYQRGINLMPDAINTELSKGHPLLFHALAAIWMKLFGSSHVSLHSFALLISVVCLITVYEIALKLFSRRVAILSLLLVAIQVVFFVQASFVLPEILIALLTLLSFYYYIKRQYLATAIMLTFLFFTKESGLIAGLVLGQDAFINGIRAKRDRKNSLYSICSVIVPFAFIVIFFIVQKQVHGWYLYPEHVGYLRLGWWNFFYMFRLASVHASFVLDLRYCYFFILLLLCLLVTIKTKNYKYLVLFAPAVVIYFLVDETYRLDKVFHGLPFFLFFVLSCLLSLRVLKQLGLYDNELQGKFIVLFFGFIFCFFCFTALNFFTPRYLLVAIVPLLMILAALLMKMMRLTDERLFYPVACIVLVIGFFSFKTNTRHSDVDPGAFDAMNVQKQEIVFFERNNYYDRAIATGSILTSIHLTHPESGFLHSGKTCNNVKWAVDAHTEFVVFNNVDPDYRYKEVLSDTTFHLVHRYEKGNVWGEIYQRH